MGEWIVSVTSFQKIYGLYSLKQHSMEINGDVTMETTNRKVKIGLVSKSAKDCWTADFRNSVQRIRNWTHYTSSSRPSGSKQSSGTLPRSDVGYIRDGILCLCSVFAWHKSLPYGSPGARQGIESTWDQQIHCWSGIWAFELKIPSLYSWLIIIKFRGGLAAKTLVATALYGKRVLLPRTKLFTLHSTKPQQARVEVWADD